MGDGCFGKDGKSRGDGGFGKRGKSGGTGKDGKSDGKGAGGKSLGKGKVGKSDGKGKFKGKGGKSGGKGQGFNAMQMFLRVRDLRSRLIAGLAQIDRVLHDPNGALNAPRHDPATTSAHTGRARQGRG